MACLRDWWINLLHVRWSACLRSMSVRWPVLSQALTVVCSTGSNSFSHSKVSFVPWRPVEGAELGRMFELLRVHLAIPAAEAAGAWTKGDSRPSPPSAKLRVAWSHWLSDTGLPRMDSKVSRNTASTCWRMSRTYETAVEQPAKEKGEAACREAAAEERQLGL